MTYWEKVSSIWQILSFSSFTTKTDGFDNFNNTCKQQKTLALIRSGWLIKVLSGSRAKPWYQLDHFEVYPKLQWGSGWLNRPPVGHGQSPSRGSRGEKQISYYTKKFQSPQYTDIMWWIFISWPFSSTCSPWVHDYMTFDFQSIEYRSLDDDLGIGIFWWYLFFSLSSKSEFYRKFRILCQEVVVKNASMEWNKKLEIWYNCPWDNHPPNNIHF